MAAQSIVCFVSRTAARLVAVSAPLAAPFLLLAFLVALFSAAATGAPRSSAESNARPKGTYLFHASLNKNTFEEKIEDFTPPQSTQTPSSTTTSSGNAFIERIDFVGNRRIRTDTLKARIFSRDGDPYNEDTLRRDFQALWNTQYFEDVKLEVQDSPNKPNGKIIIFIVTERPVIRRIRYEGAHSVRSQIFWTASRKKRSV
jgi:Outer membrane protein/protective antigen OMA87